MTIGITEKPSLLASLLAKELQEQSGKPAEVQANGIFADRLDKILASQPSQNARSTAQSLAETLNLQMLHSTLALAGDTSAESPLQSQISSRSPSFLALARAYGAHQAAPAASAGQPAEARQPLPEPSPASSHAPAVAASPPAPAPAPGSGGLDSIISKASSRYGVDAGLIKAVIKAESNFNPNAVSHAGARGLMQLMPATARSLGVNDSFDPEQNVMAGTRFLRDLLSRYKGNLDSTLAAYNWGPGNVDKRPDRLPRETQDYLARVKQLYASYSA